MNEQADLSHPGRRFDWDRVTGVSALLVSLVAVLVAAYTAQLQRQQVRAQVWPHVIFYNAGNLGEFHVANKGMGPAMVQSVRATVDGKPVQDWTRLAGMIGLSGDGLTYSSLNGAVLAPGDDFTYLQPQTREKFDLLRAAAGQRWNVALCYCSALDECWTAESHPRNPEDATREVKACPRFNSALEFEN